MIVLRRYILSGAALLTVAGGARAADLPAFKSTPVEYVRVCDAYGAGFFYIPGTDTCLRVNGALRAEYIVRGNAPTDNPFARTANLAGHVYTRDLSNLRARAFFNLDARTQTAYGTIRTYLSIRTTTETTAVGPYGGGSFTPAGATVSERTSLFQGYPSGAVTILDKGFIQFAGITAGRAQSFFDFDARSRELIGNTLANSNQPTQMFAYTFVLKDYSATISVEDPAERRIGDSGFVQSNLNPTATKAGYQAYAGASIPDIVGNARVDQAWGSAQLSAAYHQVSSLAVQLPNGATMAPGDKNGFAGQAGVKVLLPFITKGDNATVQGVYETGAMDYINSLNYQSDGLSNVYSHNLAVGLPVNDAFVLPGGRLGLNRAYGGYAAYQHYWAPDWYSTIYGDYTTIHNPYAATLISAGGGGDNAHIYQVGGNLIWTPVKDLIIGGEVLYTNMHLTGGAALSTTKSGTVSTPTPSDPDDIRGRLSIRRAF